jgi:proline dehydrogenase
VIDALSKAFFGTLAGSRGLQRMASRYGMRSDRSFARRFVAGETVAEAIRAAQAIEAQGLTQTLDLLGETVGSERDAHAATDAYLAMMPAMIEADIARNISIKLTQLGLDLDRDLCVTNLRAILARARDDGFFVRIDMENSPYTAVTLEVFETLWQQEYRNLGVALQACLFRTEVDVKRMNELGARVRLVKGAYKEPAAVAHQQKADVDAAYLRLMRLLLDGGTYPAIATHDEAMLDATCSYAKERNIAGDRYEFQMLYGIRRDLQASLSGKGHRVRVYVPFGREWFPYFMRRLGERPANVAFVLRGIFSEGRH